MAEIIIPTTKLRHYYEFLSKFTNEAARDYMAESICKSIQRKKDLKKHERKIDTLIKIVMESMIHFKQYCNIENFVNDTSSRIKLVSKNLKNGEYGDDKEVMLDIIHTNTFLETDETKREIDPRRATLSKYESGTSAKGSGGGGIDLLAWDTNTDTPFIGEIKTHSDKDAFYALIQLLTYFTELSTPNQIERSNLHNLFPNKLKKSQKFSLGVIFSDFSKRSDVQILKNTKAIAQYIAKEIKQISYINFLNMEKPFMNFQVL